MKSRRHDPERLDDTGHDPELLSRSLAHVEAVDRWLGGSRALRRALAPLLPAQGRLSLLDVGTGDGGVARRLASWLTKRGLAVDAIGLDLHPEILAAASRRGEVSSPNARAALRLVRGDALRLPFSDDAFHLAISTLTLHHFGDHEARRIVREMARVASIGVLVGDLERHTVHHLGARLLSATLWRRNPITRHDGPLSVLRSFTSSELADVGTGAGLRDVRVRRHPFFRLVLVGRP